MVFWRLRFNKFCVFAWWQHWPPKCSHIELQRGRSAQYVNIVKYNSNLAVMFVSTFCFIGFIVFILSTIHLRWTLRRPSYPLPEPWSLLRFIFVIYWHLIPTRTNNVSKPTVVELRCTLRRPSYPQPGLATLSQFAHFLTPFENDFHEKYANNMPLLSLFCGTFRRQTYSN